MKPQDILFFLIFFFLLYKRNSQQAILAGLLCLVIAMPLFAKWIFFTAERLTWYAGGFFLLGILLQLFYVSKTKNQKNDIIL